MALAYCTLNDIKDVLSTEGVDLRLDDSPPSTYADVIDEASQSVAFYTWERYSDSTLAANLWIKHATKVVGALLLCERRGNPVPVGILERFGRYEKQLELIRTAKAKIPNAALRKSAVPVMSNLRAVTRPYPRIVVEGTQSTGHPENYSQNRDPIELSGLQLDYII